MTVTVNPNVTPNFTQIAPICSGGSFSLPTTSDNGIAGTWAPAVNNSQTTTYTFTPNSGQCATTATMTVNGQSKPDAEFCAGRSDLFGRQFFAAHNFEQRHHRDLGAGGK
jgi:hypothetical protein